MKVFVQVLGTDTGDSTPSLLVFFDSKRYLFNCGEGTQRFCTEHRVRLARVDNIFITRLAWDNIGGLPGALLTISDVGVNKINLYGPSNTLNFLEATRYFISRWDLTLNISEFVNSQNVFQDECMRVVPIVITGNDQKEDSIVTGMAKLQTGAELESQDEIIEEKYGVHAKPASFITLNESANDKGLTGTYTVQLKQEYTKREDPECPVHTATPGRVAPLQKLTKTTKPLNTVVCYACHTADIPGKFDAKVADALGVPLKSRSLLVKGQPVTLESGKVVQPSDCISAATPGRIMLIVHIPNISISERLLWDPTPTGFEPYQQGPQGIYAAQVAVVFHMAPASVIEQEKYKEWMSRFHPQAQHVIVNPHHCTRPIVFESSAANQMRLNTLHPIIFRACSEQMKPQMPLPTIPSPLKLVSASPLLKFHLSPSNAVGLDLTDLSKPIELSKIMAPFTGDVHPSFTKNRSALRDRINAHNLAFASRPPMPLYEPYEVIFLGTGAALPSKYRNVSSTLVKVKGFGSFLLDAGEGTYGQMSRYFCDMAQLNNEILQLRCIFISHMHADHHLGVARILAKRNELGKGTQNPPLLVIAPPHYQNWINEYTQVENLNIALFNAYELVYPVAPVGIGSANSEIRVQLLAELRTLLGFVAVEMVPVVHCPDAFGVVLKHTDGWSIVFSGDTRPCPLLDQAGLGCDLLIHEATFEDQLTSEAIDKNHATTTEAIQSATNMKAKFLMMTHFSQRYPKIPVFDERYNLSTGVAFDLMRVTPSDFPILPFFLDCLKDLFDEDAEPEDKDEVDDTAASSSAPPSKKPKKK